MNKKILVAYFSHSGNTEVVANNIKETVGADIFEIKTVERYPNEYNLVVDKAKKEQDTDYRPKLTANVQDIDSYDVVFVGYPNWWGTMPMAVFTFMGEYDFSEKTIVPFCTHEGSGLGRSEKDVAQLCPESTVLKGLAIYGSRVNSAKKDVENWLSTLGMI
ncbi:MAG: flavodoxin [Methanobacterium paludis]|nr:flavodoxin [Methanobacterium paludis]